MSMRLAAAVLALAGSAQADDDDRSLKWLVGSPGQTCHQACNSYNLNCVPRNPITAAELSDAAYEARQVCTTIEPIAAGGTKNTMPVPYITLDTATCFYNGGANALLDANICSDVPTVTAKMESRICACSENNVRWLVGANGESCDTTCGRQDLVCGVVVEQVPYTRQQMQSMTQAADVDCDDFQQVTNLNLAPSVSSGICFFPQATMPPKCSQVVDFMDVVQRRICPCHG
jgi:hypothetical protein